MRNNQLLCVLFWATLFSTAIFVLEAGAAGIEQAECPKPFGFWVTALPDGRVMTWWPEEKPGTADATGTVQLAFARFSRDNGATWTKPLVLFEFPRTEGKARYIAGADGATLCDKQGGIHIFGVLRRVAFDWETYKGNLAVFHVMSDDNGKTWSDVQIVPTGYKYCGIHQPVVSKTGRIILPIWHVFDDKRKWGAFCALSDDRGKTWRSGKEIIADSTAPVQLDEQSGVELNDGRIWMLFRQLHGGHLVEASSPNGGESWQDVRDSRFVSPAAPPAMRRLADGRILLVWNNSLKPKHVFNRLVLAAAISDDEGRSWRGYREIARTNGVLGPQGWVCYPFITQTDDGTVIVTYGTADFTANMLRLDPDWLEEIRFREEFSTGLDNWVTLQTEGPKLVAHPDHPDRKVLALPKPKANVASGASLNFPFGSKGKLTMRIQLRPGFQGARICLTDHFTWPYYSETGQFVCAIWSDGEIVEPLPEGELVQSGTKLTPGKWHTLEFAWDCKKRRCVLSFDSKPVTDLSQMSALPGVCYLRLWSAAKQTDAAGLLVESVDVSIQP